MSYVLPECPTGCNNAPPIFAFDDCNPEIHIGPIEYIYLRQRGQDFTDWTQSAEWAANIDNSGNLSTDIRQLRVIGELVEPEVNEKIISGNRRYLGAKTFTINFEVDELGDLNYEALRQNECNGNYSVWFETSNSSGTAGDLFGGNPGIEGFVSMSLTIQRDENEQHRIIGKITWQSKFHPERILSPINH
jgi:hypothetical protein